MRLLHFVCIASAALVSLGMHWRDELEHHDGSHVGMVALLAVLAQLAFVGELTWAGVWLLPAIHVSTGAACSSGKSTEHTCVWSITPCQLHD